MFAYSLQTASTHEQSRFDFICSVCVYVCVFAFTGPSVCSVLMSIRCLQIRARLI